jgi:hypothetical protein
MKQIFALLMFVACCSATLSQFPANTSERLNNILPIRGLCAIVPQSANVDEFIKFIEKELTPRNVNTIILRIDYNYQFESHPELRDSGALSKNEIKKLVAVCRKNNIHLIPQINLLGHQSNSIRPNPLLKAYPEFDETPLFKYPGKFIWPNANNFYCKSYCPLHPEVHKVIFDVLDEICDVFETDAFHAGMDEIFYIGETQCPRCKGKDKAELFAGEVHTIRDHLAGKGRKLWIWGDRLLDGKTTGIGEWEASYNNTYRAIDMIPKDILICDWHYPLPVPTAVYFAMKGFDVVECPWNVPETAVRQVQDMVRFRNNSTPELRKHFLGMVQTEWSRGNQFIECFYGKNPENTRVTKSVDCFKALFDEIQKILDSK